MSKPIFALKSPNKITFTLWVICWMVFNLSESDFFLGLDMSGAMQWAFGEDKCDFQYSVTYVVDVFYYVSVPFM